MSFPIRIILILLSIVSVPCFLFVWLMPVEFFQSWMVERASPDRYSRYSAYEQAWVLWAILRILLPAIAVFSVLGLIFCNRLSRFLENCWRTVSAWTSIDREGKRDSKRTILFRFILWGWLCLGLFHLSGGLLRRIEDWPWYHFDSGPAVLPNISESNRDVIRFLEETTDKNARILVVSDQKLFFLSYYLLPRRLFHPMHPGSEFVIPQKNQQRQLLAYRLSDLDAEYISRISPDYILEYFEGIDFIEKKRFREDRRWLQFLRRRYGDDFQPTYNVRLRKYHPSMATRFQAKPESAVKP